jgi:predicted component of type VI protein secretion system
MPMTEGQITRQKAEGSLRRQFDHFITDLTPEELAALAEKWEAAESALAVIARFRNQRTAPHTTRPVFEDGRWHEKDC